MKIKILSIYDLPDDITEEVVDNWYYSSDVITDNIDDTELLDWIKDYQSPDKEEIDGLDELKDKLTQEIKKHNARAKRMCELQEQIDKLQTELDELENG